MNKLHPTICAFLSILLLSTVSFSQHVENPEFEKVLKRRIPKSVPTIDVKDVDLTDEDILFIDARTLHEFLVSHIEHSIMYTSRSMPLDSVAVIPKSTRIIVYCTVGVRSTKVAKVIMEQGFTDVSNLYGGIVEWSNQKKPLVDTVPNPTTNVHPFNEKWGKWLTHGTKKYFYKRK